MRGGEHNVARAYVLYREKRHLERAHSDAPVETPAGSSGLTVTDKGVSRPLDMKALHGLVAAACEGLGSAVNPDPIVAETVKNLYDGVPLSQVYDSAILAARTMIEKDPAYSQVTARILLHTIRREILGEEVAQGEMQARYAEYFPQFLKRAASKPSCSTTSCCSSIWCAWARRSTRAATCSSATSACRRCTTATSCTSKAPASRCPRRSTCAWRWASRSTR